MKIEIYFLIHLECPTLLNNCDLAMPPYIVLLLICALLHNLQAAYHPLGYTGCIVDSKNRCLNVQLNNSFTNSGGNCKSSYMKLQYKYAGTQYGIECSCGNDLKISDKRPYHEYNITCPGNKDEYCGGQCRISMYDTGFSDENSGSSATSNILISTAVFVAAIIALVPFFVRRMKSGRGTVCFGYRLINKVRPGTFRVEENQRNITDVRGQISISEEGHYDEIRFDSIRSSSLPNNGYFIARIPSVVREQTRV